MVVQLQLASARDAEPIALLSRNLIEAGLGWSWTPARVSRAIDTPDANVLVAITRTNVVGFGIMRYHWFSAHLDLLAVTSPHQRRGLGRRLLHWLEEAATTAGAVYVFAEARALRPGALAVYERLPGYYGGQEEGVRLAKSLRHTIVPSAGQTPVGFDAGRHGRSFPPT
jgi:ribosomal protein S18 acetylase RimI-like enzyme